MSYCNSAAAKREAWLSTAIKGDAVLGRAHEMKISSAIVKLRWAFVMSTGPRNEAFPGSLKGSLVMESWRNRKTLILSRTDMMGLLTPAEYVNCVEQAYRMHGEGRYYMDPKGHIVLDKYPGEWEAMPSYIEEPEAAACKWVSIRERNREKYDLPTVFSILIYTHPETGFPLAICDGSYHTVMRTGAAAAVSAKWMARKNSTRLAIVGAGHMGRRNACDLQRSVQVGAGVYLEPLAEDARRIRRVSATEIPGFQDQYQPQPRGSGARRGCGGYRNAGP